MQKLKLISFPICPFAQKTIITFNLKGAEFDVEYVDPSKKPAWFYDFSPSWKVPILVVDDNNVIFESDVINEYIDETITPSLLPQDPLNKAWVRAWIKFSSEVLSDFNSMVFAYDQNSFEQTYKDFLKKLEKLEDVIWKDWFFYGKQPTMIDANFWVIFYRLYQFEFMKNDSKFRSFNKVAKWADNLNSMQEIKWSVPNWFNWFFESFLKNKQSYLYQFLNTKK